MNKDSIRNWIESFDSGEYESKDVETQIKAGWYDWFCKATSLRGKTNALAPKVKRIANSHKINQDTMYVWFKNNCPLYGNLYDDIRIADLETDDVIFTITPKCGHTSKNGQAEVWGRENDFYEPIVTGTWKDVLVFFGV